MKSLPPLAPECAPRLSLELTEAHAQRLREAGFEQPAAGDVLSLRNHGGYKSLWLLPPVSEKQERPVVSWVLDVEGEARLAQAEVF